MATDTRDKLVEAGIELFYQHGFHAVGLDRILQEVGVTKTTFYNHFESKEDLIRSAIEEQGVRVRSQMNAGVDRLGNGDPRLRLLAVFDVLGEMFHEATCRGCLAINALVEFPGPHDDVHRTARKIKTAMREFYRQLAEAAGVVDSAPSTDDFVMLVDATIIAHQTHGHPQAAARGRKIAEMLLEKESAS
jgi:AcrR family transcriptional regulator